MRVLYLILLLMMFVVAACSTHAEATNRLPDPDSVGDPAAGQEIFNTQHGEAPPCSMCHNVAGNSTGYAPSLEGVASRAGKQVEGLDAVAYLRQSIIDPTAFDADPEGTTRMYEHFQEALTEDEINNVIAYLLTLK